jgi:carbamoyl-phosphate synthase large subunit
MGITVAITSCGGEIIPGIIDCLRTEEEHRFKIVGVDVDDQAVGKKFVDTFYQVPGGLKEEYIPRMINIAERESLDVIVPLSDQETLSLSQNKYKFEGVGTKILTPDADTVRVASDKGAMLEHLDSKGVDVPKYFLPESFEELDEAVESLGYPEQEVVLKPRRQRAARGFWILSEERGTQDLILNERCLQRLPYQVLRALLEDGCGFPEELLVMEYLKGDDFNVDALSIEGQSIYEIPIKRIKPAAGPVQVGDVVHDSKVQDMVREICSAFGFNLNVNVEVAYRKDKEGRPLVYEINPRVSGPIAVHKHTGVNLLMYGILASLGGEVPKELKYKELRVHRCWQEIYDMNEG